MWVAVGAGSAHGVVVCCWEGSARGGSYQCRWWGCPGFVVVVVVVVVVVSWGVSRVEVVSVLLVVVGLLLPSLVCTQVLQTMLLAL
jgi:hypothetical protein